MEPITAAQPVISTSHSTGKYFAHSLILLYFACYHVGQLMSIAHAAVAPAGPWGPRARWQTGSTLSMAGLGPLPTCLCKTSLTAVDQAPATEVKTLSYFTGL